MPGYELIVVYFDGSKDIFRYATECSARHGGESMKMVLGDQIVWWGVRKAR